MTTIEVVLTNGLSPCCSRVSHYFLRDLMMLEDMPAEDDQEHCRIGELCD
jgi:hypothetical protein